MNIVYKDLSREGPIEECRELCNKLMRHRETVGYIFCDAFTVTDEMVHSRPEWLRDVLEYRGERIGQRLIEQGLSWMRHVPDAKYMFVYVSNRQQRRAVL